jgi:hypothetical protein
MKNIITALLIINPAIIFLFWLAGMVVIEPVHNHFVQYGQNGGILPDLTQFIVDYRMFFMGISVLWSFISIKLYQILNNKKKEDQSKILLLYCMVSILIGFLVLIIFGLAAILPYLLVGVTV